MSVYRRNGGRCQRWEPYKGEWYDVPLDEPETRKRPPTEGMIVHTTNDFASEGPLCLSINALLKSWTPPSDDPPTPDAVVPAGR